MKNTQSTRRSIARHIRNRRFEIATIATVLGAAACGVESNPAGTARTGKATSAVITSAQGTAAAQKAMDFLVPDAVAFTQSSSCLSCHRQPDVLISASTAAALLPGITLDTSASTGTGFIANLVTTSQSQDGHWTSSGSTTSMSAESLWALAGYARAGGAVDVLPNIKSGLLWLVPQASTTTFAADSGPFAGGQRTYLHNDFTGAPQMFDWYLPTTQVVFATKALLDLDGTMSASDVSALSAQQASYTDALEGTTMRALSSSTVQQLSLAAVAMAESGRASSANGQAIGTELMARQTVSSGWADAFSPDPQLHSTNALTTGQAMYALCRLGIRPRKTATVGAGLDWLTSQQQDSGEWLLPGHDSTVSSSWALLSIACVSNATGTAEFNPLTGSGSPSAPVTESLSTMLNVTNTAADARVASITVTGGPPGTVISVSPSSTSIDGDSSTPVTVTMTFPKNLSPSLSYPFTAHVAFASGGASPASAVQAIYTAAIGTIADDSLSQTTTTLSNPPTQVIIGSTVSFAANVLDSTSHIVHPGSLSYAIDDGTFATVTVTSDVFATSWVVPALSLGAHTLHVAYLGDSSDGVFAPSWTDQVLTVIQPPPPAPTVIGMTNGSASSTGIFPVSGTGSPGDTIAIVANNIVVGTATIGSDGTWTSSVSLSPGDYAVSFVETGPGGASTPATRHVTVQPGAPIVAGPASGTSFSGMVTTVSGTAMPGALIEVKRDGAVVGSTTAGSDGSYSVGVDLVAGPNVLAVSQTVAGQTSTLAGVTYNRTPSAPSIIVPNASKSAQRSSAVVISGSTVPGATVVLVDNGVVIASAVAGPDGRYSIPATLSSGKNVLTVTSSVGGVVGAPSAAIEVRVDGDAPFFPAPPVSLLAYSPTSNGVAVSWPAISAYDAQDGKLSSGCSPAAGSVFPLGKTTVFCSASDRVGNMGQATFQVNVVLQKLPTLTLPAKKLLTVDTHLTTGANVSFDVTADDARGLPIAATCSPASGSFFQVGTTRVTCSATDSLAKTFASESFDVVVTSTPYPMAAAAPDSVSYVGGGGCTVTPANAASSGGIWGLFGLALVVARRLRRKERNVA